MADIEDLIDFSDECDGLPIEDGSADLHTLDFSDECDGLPIEDASADLHTLDFSDECDGLPIEDASADLHTLDFSDECDGLPIEDALADLHILENEELDYIPSCDSKDLSQEDFDNAGIDLNEENEANNIDPSECDLVDNKLEEISELDFYLDASESEYVLKSYTFKQGYFTQLCGVVIRAPDSGPRGPRSESRAWRIFHDLGKVSEY
jgi:hypothetical protein